MRLRLAVIPLLLAVAALVAAGCGGGTSKASSGPYGGSNTTTAAVSSSGHATTIKTGHSSALGTFLVDNQGRTLYLFEADKGPKSTCNGACASAWPPETTSSPPKAAGGAKSSLLGRSKRSDGTMQVTYHGHPLYRYAGDSRAGDTNGQGLDQFGAEWYVLAPKGSKIDKS